jgi:cytoskeletal protein CcmA (bactofilin family)
MVKNLNTIERSERIRIGKYTPDEQAINSIIINASSDLLDANVSGFHVSPIRKDSSVLSNTLVYNTVTKEIVDSGENVNKSLEDVTAIGNTTPYTVEFQNTTTSFVTYGSVGIANTAPVHTLDIGSNVSIDDTGSNVMDVTGNIFVSDTLFVVGNLEVLGDTTLTTQQNLLIDDSIVELGKNNYESDAGFDLGFVMTRSSAVSNVGVGYREAQDEFFIGYTDNNAYEHYLTPNSDNNVKVHVYGSIVTDANVGVANTSPTHTLDVGSNLYVDDTASNVLVVHGDTKIDEKLFVNNVSVSNVLDVSGNLNALSELNVTGNLYASSNLDVAGIIYASSNVDVSKELNVSGNVYASSNVDVSGELSVSGNVYASSNVDVSKELNVSGNVYASSNVDVSGELNVSGNVYASSNVDVSKELNVTGNVYASSNVDVSGEFNVSGNVYASSNVDVSQQLNVTGDVNASSNVNVTKDLNVTRNIFASSNVVVSRDLAVVRDIYASNITANKKLTVTEDIDALSNVNVTKDLNVTGNVFANSNVSVTKDLDILGNVYASNNLNVSKNIIVTGNVLANSNIVVSNEAVIKGDLYTSGNAFISKELTVTQDLTASANVDVTKHLNVTGNVFANSNISVANQLGVSGNAYVSKRLFVTGDVIASSNVDVTRDINVTRDVIISRNANVTGNVTSSYFYGSGNTLSNVTLEQVTSYGNSTSNTVFFNNPDIAVVTEGDMGVGTDTPDKKLHVAGDILADANVYAVQYFGAGNTLSNVTLQVVTDKGNTTSNTVQFTNPTTAFTTDLVSNVEVKLDQLSNVIVTDPQSDHLLVYDGENWVNDFNLHNFIKIHNLTGSTLHRGNVVYIVDSFNNNVANVALAKADSSATMPAIGLIHEDVAPGQEGVAVAYGKVSGIDTLGFTEGQTVYVSNTSAGHIMNSKPYGLGDQIQNVGICIRVHKNNGVVFVTGVGRSNDIPNAPISSAPNYVYVNETNNDMKKIAPEDLLTKLQTLEQVVNTGNTVANTINLTGLTTTGNVEVGGDISIDGLTIDYLPMVGANNYLVDSPIRKDNGSIIIDADTEVTGNLYITGNSISISSNSLVISDRILGIANNNPSHDLDAGLIIEHPGHNIALIHHGDEDRFSMGYTQNTITDDHVLPDLSNAFYLDILGNVHVQDNIFVQNNITVVDTVYANFFSGDGGLLSNLASDFEEIIINGNTTSNTVEFRGTTSLVTTGSVGIANTEPGHDLSVGSNLYVDDTGSNVLHVTGNVYATQFFGDGSQLTGLVTTLEDVANNGNTTSNTIQFTNSDVGIVATGNVEAAYFKGDGSQLTGLVTTLEDVANNGNTTSNTIQFTNSDVGIIATGNVEAAYFKGDGSELTGIATTLQSVSDFGNTTSNTIQFTNSNVGIVATGNVEAAYFVGDGSQLTGVITSLSLQSVTDDGNTTSNTVQFTNTETSFVTSGSVGIANTLPGHDLSVGSNLWIDDDSSNVLTVDGNILAHRMTLDSIQIASVYALEYVTMEGNTSSNTVEFTNATTGLVTVGNVGVANTLAIHTLDVGSNLYVDDVGSNVLHVNGNTWSNEVYTNKLGVANLTSDHDLSVASNLYVDDDGSNVLVVSGNASFGSTITLGAVEITTAYNLEEVTGEGNTTSNTVQFTNTDVGIVASGGIVTHSDGYACKRYSYSNVNIPVGFSNVGLTFSSNVFFAKVTAQLLHGNEEVSTLVFDTQGGTRDGTTSSLDIAVGSKSLFGNTNTKPWSSVVDTTPTMVILEPSAVGSSTYGCDLFVEYMSSAPDGKLESISVDAINVKSFVY